ncbi:MAG: class II fumarate hydratase [Deltaproteobacteria bacterium]|nr:class II fumarate hydratase [Deltaproteobacteria bacterium]MBW2611513.1 class II fumarate hydratase [Deltaproteobacteria bacterium]MBW2676787.1 class II fumarate hydratase [Deltaproteobacteria bacterium]
MKYREDKDSLGIVAVPAEAYYGAQTERARQNTIDSGLRLPSAFMHTLALIKLFASQVNADLKLLDPDVAGAIGVSAREVMEGRMDSQFVVDLFQTGSGTSANMNMNEVIASRANELLTGKIGGKSPVHPNDHVNLGQSSNDVIPTALHISVLGAIEGELLPRLELLKGALTEKASVFKNIRKIGRTHLQDAVPMSLGNEFSGYARQAELSISRVQNASTNLRELALGGTAVGSGLNTLPEFAPAVIARINDYLKMDFVEAENRFEAQGARDAAVEMSGTLKSVAVSLTKIADDVRWLASGPRCGLGEIRLPNLQPGSSIMPGKVNPIIPEVVIQAAAQVIGNDTTITFAGQKGQFELNTMQPLIAYNLLQSIQILGESARVFAEKCIRGIEADEARCAGNLEKSLAMVTYLVPLLGYDRAAELSKRAHETGKTVREVVIEEGIITPEKFDDLIQR